MNPIFLWWLTLGALIGFVAAWIWDWFWFRARRQVVSTDVDTQISTLVGERDKLATDLKACGERRVSLEADLTAARGDLAAVRGELATAQSKLGELDGLRVRLGELEAANAGLRAELDAARATAATAATVAVAQPLAARAVGDSDNNDMILTLRDYNVALQDEITATRRTLARFAGGRGDPLIDIDGIGPVYQQKLYDAGVISFDQVAAMHPERLRSVVAPNAVFQLETDSWTEQARRLATFPVRDPLIDINGVGPVYEQRLLNAGVTSFEQLAGMSEAEVRAIVKPESWQNVDIVSWITEARQLADQVRAGTYRKGEY